ncbi:MAG: LCP family protein [Mycobacterium sp.]|uniref:LCP family protein n=1 Tax=Mycobacterium sp. TaxID=1785 RepID=UPI003CC6BE3B
MSDGDDGAAKATRAGAGADHMEEVTRQTTLRPFGAAPWERFQQRAEAGFRAVAGSAERSAAPPTEPAEKPADSAGNHAGGELTVAELIAKVGGVPAKRPRHHHAAPEADSTEVLAAAPDEANEFSAGHDIALDTPEHPPARAYADEWPDLEPAYPFEPAEPEEPLAFADTDDAALVEGEPDPHALNAASRGGRRPLMLAGRSLAALIAVLSLALTGGAYQWSASKNNRLNTVSALDPHSRDVVNPNGQFGDENFLIVGMDTRAGANSQMGAGDTDDAGGARSDTVMLVNIPANRKRVVAVSFPRDLAITPVRCEAWNPDTGAYGPLYDDKTRTWGPDMVYTETKLNSAFSFGGPKCLVKVIQKLSGLSINRFMAIDFVGFSKMVDALGGVEVCSTTPLRDYELGTVLEHSGRQIVDGSTALNYVRARQVTTEDNGDYGRIKRQQLFLSSLLRSLITRDTFFSLGKLNNVVNMFINDSYVDNVKTKDLVDLGQSVQGLTAGHITFVTIPTTGITDEDGNEPPRTADVRALFDAIINDDPLPGENDANAQDMGPTPAKTRSTTSKAPKPSPTGQPHPDQVQAVTTSPQDVTVQVSNATGRTGLATTATNELEQRGFNVETPNDYPKTVSSTTVFFSPGNEQAAATVATTLANSKIERVTGIGSLVQVVLGPDFRAVAAPPPSGSSVSMLVNHNTSSAPTKLPEDLSVTNAADTRCE